MNIAIDTTALVILTLSIVLVGANFGALPDRIPIHFGLTGKPDRYGPKAAILMWPILTLGVFLLFTALPYALSRGLLPPKPGTDVPRTIAFLGAIKLEAMAFLTYVEWSAIAVALDRERGIQIAAVAAFVLVAAGTSFLILRP